MKRFFLILVVIFITIWGGFWYYARVAPSEIDSSHPVAGEAVGYFAGGCFWCVESDFEKMDGVSEAVSGYMGGDVEHPSYKQVSGGTSGHREIVKVIYDPEQVTYRDLVLNLLSHTDPTDAGGSFYDRGHQYTSAIYYSSENENEIARAVIAELEQAHVFEDPIVTGVEPVGDFWVAEDYHQDYYLNNSLRYNYYRKGSGRDDFIESVWGDGSYDELLGIIHLDNSAWKDFIKPSDEALRSILTSLQYDVTQEEGTERPFDNEYWDNHEDGIYVDIVSGEPLFSSTDKFDSGTGWPSFLKPIDYDFVTEKKDYKLLIPRTEIRSAYADSHLGHIILDGPVDNDKIRYCMNSAAMRFIPVDQMEENSLGDFLYLFD